MNEKLRIAESIKKKIEENYKDDVAIFAYYGSQATGLAGVRSDLDMFFIPKTERGKGLNFQFVIDGIGYDLFPITWERVAKIVALDQPLAAVLTQANVLYAGSDDDLKRFQMSVNAIEAQFKNGPSLQLLNKAWSYFSDTYLLLFNMEHGKQSLLDAHVIASKMLTKVALSLGYVNGVYFKRGMGRAFKETYDFERLPEDYHVLAEAIMTEEDYDVLVEHCKTLLLKTKALINQEYKRYYEKESYMTLFEGYYEEIKSTFNKIIDACENEDAHTAYFRAIDVQSEMSLFMAKVEDGIWYEGTEQYVRYNAYFYDTFELDLIEPAFKRDFTKLKGLVETLDARFESFLEKEGLQLNIYENIESFETDFRNQV